MKNTAVLACIVVVLPLLAISPVRAVEGAESEPRTIFRIWQSLDTQAVAGPWDDYKDDGAVWQDLTLSGDQVWVNSKDVTRSGEVVTFWMQGDYSTNPKVKYRTAVWRIRIHCAEKTVAVLASSTYAADGRPIDERDDPRASTTAIRPGTIYESIAEKLCA